MKISIFALSLFFVGFGAHGSSQDPTTMINLDSKNMRGKIPAQCGEKCRKIYSEVQGAWHTEDNKVNKRRATSALSTGIKREFSKPGDLQECLATADLVFRGTTSPEEKTIPPENYAILKHDECGKLISQVKSYSERFASCVPAVSLISFPPNRASFIQSYCHKHWVFNIKTANERESQEQDLLRCFFDPAKRNPKILSKESMEQCEENAKLWLSKNPLGAKEAPRTKKTEDDSDELESVPAG